MAIGTERFSRKRKKKDLIKKHIERNANKADRKYYIEDSWFVEFMHHCP
jgi:hypothetical protein